MKNALDKARKGARRVFLTPGELLNMETEQPEAIMRLGAALREGIHSTLDADERAWFTRIEERRAALIASTNTIEIMDFGAGGSDDTFTEDQMLAGRMKTLEVAKSANAATSPRWAPVLFKIIRAFSPAACIELGTHMGIASSYMGAALTMNEHGKLITLEGAESLAGIARDNLRQLGIGCVEVRVGRFADTLDGALSDLGSIDFAFIDGHHDRDATIQYFERLLPLCTDGAVLIFDDHDWSPGMQEAWETVSKHPRVQCAVDMVPWGVTVIRDAECETKVFRVT